MPIRKQGRRLTILGLLVAILAWLGVQGLSRSSEPSEKMDPKQAQAGLPKSDAILADLFWGELRRMAAAIKSGDVRTAWSRQKRAEKLLPEIPPRDSLRAQFALVSKKLREFVAQRLGQAEAELRIGRVLAAAEQLKPFADDEQALPGDFVEAAEARGLEAIVTKIRSADFPPLPMPIAAGRQVRVLREGRLELGHVLKSSIDAVTVKLRSASGMLYPELPGFQLGLVDPAPEEALDQALRALHAGDSLLAGLWLTFASDRGAGNSRRAAEISRCLGR